MATAGGHTAAAARRRDEAEDDEVTQDSDQVIPGGWKRAALGVALGIGAGAAISLILPRDDGPRRRSLTLDPDRPDAGPEAAWRRSGPGGGRDPAP